MTEEPIPLELIDKIRNAIWDLEELGMWGEEESKYYEGWTDCLTWVRSRLYPPKMTVIEK